MQAKAHFPDYRHALAQFATGVTIVTTLAPDGRPIGLTVNSFNSVSLDPPLVLWSLALKASSLPVFLGCTHYAINVLASDQLNIAKRFATRSADRFATLAWHAGAHGMPLVDGCVAWLIAANRNQHEAGDHQILVGEVVQFEAPGGVPLIFHDGRYIAQATEELLPRALRTPWR